MKDFVGYGVAGYIGLDLNGGAEAWHRLLQSSAPTTAYNPNIAVYYA